MKKSFYIVLAVLVFSAVFSVGVSADVGNIFDGDDNGGGIDWGGDGDSIDLGSLFFLGYFLFDHPVLLLIAVVVIVIVAARRKKHGPFHSGPVPGSQAAQPVMSEAAVIEAVTAADPDFSAEQFKAYAADVFLRVQEAWEKRDWRVVRPFESDKLFNIHERQLQEYIDAKKTNHLDGQNIKEVALAFFKTDGGNEVLTVRLYASLFDYTTDDATGKLLSGSKTERQNRMYRLAFIRSVGVKTQKGAGGFTSGECPSCGAPIEVTQTGICEYCRNVITNGQYGWVLNEYAKW